MRCRPGAESAYQLIGRGHNPLDNPEGTFMVNPWHKIGVGFGCQWRCQYEVLNRPDNRVWRWTQNRQDAIQLDSPAWEYPRQPGNHYTGEHAQSSHAEPCSGASGRRAWTCRALP